MKIKLDDLQFKIMAILWKQGEGSVSSIRDHLKSDKELAITTVGTVLSRLEKKGILSHSKEGRQYIYRPLITEDQARTSMISSLTKQLFKGNSTTLVNHLLNENEFDEQELEEIERMIEGYKQRKK
ncbi:MAG: BlaI/MecI/CopY family transcriptional regulator [Roseivirga sp.]|nr:BlaI/MecI/CopY family transcriptional regulator [Roseivirga sp.]